MVRKSFKLTRVVGLADEAGSDAIPDAAGGEPGHEAAKADRVLHRYSTYLTEITNSILGAKQP
jgi:hypothetical protein